MINIKKFKLFFCFVVLVGLLSILTGCDPGDGSDPAYRNQNTVTIVKGIENSPSVKTTYGNFDKELWQTDYDVYIYFENGYIEVCDHDVVNRILFAKPSK